MKSILSIIAAVFLVASVVNAQKADDMMNEFYSSMLSGCNNTLAKVENGDKYCQCATDNFKKGFTKDGEEDFKKFAASIEKKTQEEQLKLILEYMAQDKIIKLLTQTSEICSSVLTEQKK